MVDAGPAPQSFFTVNEAFTSVTVCVPGTSNCQTIDHVLVDTGSSGLRLLSSAGGGELGLALPQANDSSGNPLYECLVFLDGYIWGSVSTADITVAGEKASAVPVHVVIPSSTSPAPPQSCTSQNPPGGNGNEGNSLQALAPTASSGLELFQQDCGLACTPGFQLQPVYYDCPTSGCNETSVSLAQQVPNPVIMFATDNNGVLIQLPSVADGGSANVQGSMIFRHRHAIQQRIRKRHRLRRTQQWDQRREISPPSLAEQAILPASLTAVRTGCSFSTVACRVCLRRAAISHAWYCPTTSPDNLSGNQPGQRTASQWLRWTINFSIENADTLFRNNNGSNTAFSTLGGSECSAGESNCAFDWGLSFFFGRNVFTAIENLSYSRRPGAVLCLLTFG